MDQALRDVGYARNCSDRIAQHRSHSSSNYLMNLVEAIGGVLNYSYRNVAAVIGLCSEPEQAVVGEILWSCIGQSYLDTGRGYNHESAGKSNRSADDVRTLQWAAWQNWAYEKSPFEKNREEDVRLSEQAQEDQAAWIERTVDLQNQVDHPSHFTESQDAALVASDDEDQDALAAAEQLLMELETDGNTSQRDLTAARQMVRGVAEDRRKVHAALERDIGSLESIHQGRQRRGD